MRRAFKPKSRYIVSGFFIYGKASNWFKSAGDSISHEIDLSVLWL
jgi:hypothetical protein